MNKPNEKQRQPSCSPALPSSPSWRLSVEIRLRAAASVLSDRPRPGVCSENGRGGTLESSSFYRIALIQLVGSTSVSTCHRAARRLRLFSVFPFDWGSASLPTHTHACPHTHTHTQRLSAIVAEAHMEFFLFFLSFFVPLKWACLGPDPAGYLSQARTLDKMVFSHHVQPENKDAELICVHLSTSPACVQRGRATWTTRSSCSVPALHLPVLACWVTSRWGVRCRSLSRFMAN